MENSNQNINPEKPKGKVFTERQMQVAAFIGGPLAAGYLFSKNYKFFENDKKALYSWLIAIALLLVFIMIGFLFQSDNKTSRLLSPIIITGLITLFYKIDMETLVDNHIQQGGEKESWGKPIFVAIVSIVLILGSVIGIIYIQESNTTTKTFGATKNEIIYKKGSINDETLNKIAYALRKVEVFTDDYKAYAYVSKTENTIEIGFFLSDENWDNQENIDYFTALRNELQYLLSAFRIKVNLIDNNQDIMRSFE